ncbi:uncharacterized protein HaLaN_10134, partial [Haematococcus lacustris]
WPLPQASDVLEYDPCAAGTCRIMTVNRTKTVPFFNSTTVLDDMAATKEAKYLGQAELFLKRHKQEEMAADSLQFTRQYYVPDWDNVAWATEVLLANITNSNVYHERLRSLLGTWAYADSLPTAPSQPSQIKARTNLLFNLQDFTDAKTNSTFAIVPDCRPSALYEDFGKMFDPLALLILWLLCLVISLVGMWELSQTVQRNTLTSFALNSPLYGNPYLMIAICWSFYNSIAPYCFLHYCFSAGKTFKFMTKLLPGVSTVVLLGSIILLWMLIPSEFDVQAPLTMSLQTFLPNQVMRDTNMAVMLVSGLAAAPLSLPALLGRG